MREREKMVSCLLFDFNWIGNSKGNIDKFFWYFIDNVILLGNLKLNSRL